MYVLTKDGITMQVASEIQVMAFEHAGWVKSGTVDKKIVPSKPVKLDIEPKTEPTVEPAVEENAVKQRKKPGRRAKA